MEGWEILWKTVLLAGLAVFAAMAFWVTTAGFNDLRRLLRGLRSKARRRRQR